MIGHGEVRELGDDIGGRHEQRPEIGLGEHGGIVVRIAKGHHAEADLFEGVDSLTLAVRLA